jgi:hypothetical protein
MKGTKVEEISTSCDFFTLVITQWIATVLTYHFMCSILLKSILGLYCELIIHFVITHFSTIINDFDAKLLFTGHGSHNVGGSSYIAC